MFGGKGGAIGNWKMCIGEGGEFSVEMSFDQ